MDLHHQVALDTPLNSRLLSKIRNVFPFGIGMDLTVNSQAFAPSSRLLWWLRWMVAVQCAGYAAQLAAPSSLNAWLLDSLGDSFVSGLDTLVAAVL